MIRVAIADDHAIVRTGLQQFLGEQENIAIVGEAANGSETLQLVRTQPVDVLIMDISMPGQSGIDILASLRAHAPDLAILPINGRDPLREAKDIWGNLDAEEAAQLAAAAGVPAVVPCHFDGVAGNLGDPDTFLRALAFRAPGISAHVLHPGDRLELPVR